MPLKILLADDSMTAQKMGKEILTGAGYEVIAVSNGAAAAKKLAEKPDICILDIIMPGYTGIEVCEKVRASMEMAKTPVLLTVGKMEHFDQKEVQRVSADGVIIKPFEASDLLATVQKFVDMLSAPKAAAAAASHDKTMVFTPPSVEEFKDDSYNQWKTEAEVHDEVTGEMPASKKSFELPADMAGAPAFLDEPVASPAPAAESSGTSRDKTVLITPPNFPAASAAAAAPAMEFATMAPIEEAPAAPSFDMGASPSFIPSELTDTAAFAPASAMPEHPIEFTAQPAVDVNPPIESGFQATAHAPVEVGQAQDPALVTGTEGFDSFKTTIGSSEPTVAPPAEDDFEARVAAAMADFEEPKQVQEEASAAVEVVEEPDYNKTQKITAIDLESMAAPSESAHEQTQVIETPVAEAASAYVHTQVIDTPEVQPSPTEVISSPAEATQVIEAPVEDTRGVPDGMMDAALVEQMQAAVANLPVETAPAEEPDVPAPVELTSATAPTVEVQHQDLELAKALAAAVGGDAPSASNSADHPQEVHEIAHTVTQVFNRMLPDIMEEVKRELAKRKKQ